MMSFFSRDKRTPYEKAKDQTREISRQIAQEKRQLTRQIAQSDREVQRLTADIRKHAVGGNKEALRTLAKAVVKVKHNKSNLYSAIANLDTIDNAVKNQLTNVRLTGVMQKSSQIAQSLSQLMKVDQMQGVTQQFSQELMKMGIMDEMLTEAIDGAMDNPDLEEEADEEVNKVLDEIFLKMGPLPTVGAKENPVAIADPEINEFDRRLQELKN